MRVSAEAHRKTEPGNTVPLEKKRGEKFKKSDPTLPQTTALRLDAAVLQPKKPTNKKQAKTPASFRYI